MLKNKNKNKNPISFSSPLFIYIYMHGNGKIVSVKSAKLTIHLQMQEENNTHGLQKPLEILVKFRDYNDTKTARWKCDQASQMPPYYPELDSG